MQFEGVIHGRALRAILGVAALAGATASAGAQGLIWTHQSVGSSWLAEAVTLGGDGEHVFTEVGRAAFPGAAEREDGNDERRENLSMCRFI